MTGGHLRARDYEIRVVDLSVCRAVVERWHYSGGGSNTATFRHGLFRRGRTGPCLGVAWWIPPTKSAALATWPSNWQGVLSLHRLVIHPLVPTNGASFLIARSIKQVRLDKRWECLVTYADEGQGHIGTIYQATNWEYMGKTQPETRWVDADGRHVARKAGPKTRTKAEMKALGYVEAGKFAKHKYRMVLR